MKIQKVHKSEIKKERLGFFCRFILGSKSLPIFAECLENIFQLLTDY